MIEAFLDLLLQPRLWSVKQLHSDGGPIQHAWAECFEHASHSARLMKVCESKCFFECFSPLSDQAFLEGGMIQVADLHIAIVA